MSTTVTYNSIPYFIPAYGDTGYAQGAGNLSAYLIALATGSLTKAGGTFTLTGDVNLGANFGLLSKYFTSITSTPATAGVIRLAKTDTIDWRDNANATNLALGIDGSDNLTFKGTAVTVGGVTSITGTTSQIIASSPNGAVTLSTPQSIATTSSPTFNQVTTDSGGSHSAVLSGGGLVLPTSGALTFQNTAGTQDITVQSATITTGYNLNLPVSQGGASTTLQNDGSGNLSWVTPATGVGTVNAGTATHLAYYATSTDAVSDASGHTISGDYTYSGTPTYQKAPVYAATSIAGTGTVTPDATLGPTFYTTVTGALTLHGPTSGYDTQKVTFRLSQDSSGHTVTFATGAGNFHFGTDIPSFTATGANGKDYVVAVYDAGTNLWDIVAVNQGF